MCKFYAYEVFVEREIEYQSPCGSASHVSHVSSQEVEPSLLYLYTSKDRDGERHCCT